MRIALFLLPFAIAASCGGVISGSDGGSDASGACTVDTDCSKGYVCRFPVSGGCSATPACMLEVECKGLPACACDGTDVSACGGATKPIAHSGPCVDADGPPICASGLACEVCDVSGFTVAPQAKPHDAANACTPQEIASFVTACVGAAATQQACSAWQQSDAGACGACVLTMDTSATWGPIVCNSSSCSINIGGCIDVVSGQVASENGTNGSCGDLTNAFDECVDYACGACAATSDSATCSNDAQQAECKSYFDAAQSSSSCASVDAGASTCSPQTDADWASFINVFCGTGS